MRGAAKPQRAIVPLAISATSDSLLIAPELFAFRVARIGQIAIYVLEALGDGILAASGTAEAVIAVAAGIVATKMVLDIWGTRMRLANGTEVANYLLQLLRDPAEGEPAETGQRDAVATGSPPLIPSPPVVRLPGFTLDDHPAFQIPELTPAAPVAPMPGFTPQPIQPLAPPDTGPVVTRPLVMEQAGRTGDPTRTRSERARRVARASEPALRNEIRHRTRIRDRSIETNAG